MSHTIRLIPFQERYRQQAGQMMQEINEEFSLPPHHPAYQPNEPDYYWLALKDDIVIGSVAILLADNYAILKRMFVKKDFRGKETGVAGKLLKTAIQQCTQLNIRRMYLGTMDVLVAAQKFYEKNGFVPIEQQSLPHDFKHNLSDNVFYMITITG